MRLWHRELNVIDLKRLEKGFRDHRENPGADNYFALYRKCVEDRKMDPEMVDRILELNLERKKLIGEVENNKAHQNKVGQEIAKKKRAKEDASSELEEMQVISARNKKLQEELSAAEEKVHYLQQTLPNLCHESVPVGASEEDNQVVSTVGEPRTFNFPAKEHWELGEALGGIDFERASKVTGARFAFLRGEVARLELALGMFMLDQQTREHGYEAVIPPYIANSQTFFGTGQFPKFKDDVFHLEGTDYHLIPTAEAPLTNFFAEEVLPEDQLPVRFAGFSPCFRSEAGSYGRDTKGLIRQHQFHKVELMTFAHPEKSYEEHDKLTSDAEKILQLLELPYRKTVLCTGDISFGAAKCYDLEVWLPGQNAYREISSCSNFEDFQARRANIRFKPKGGGKPQFVHTLNGSGLAVGRTLVAVLENYQNEDGSIELPKALQGYMDGKTKLI